jgi:BirA family biotin operon repressor/biotin-[acetyl-CoA-carboxylase] ligase
VTRGDEAGTSAAALLAELRTQSIGRALRVFSEVRSTIDVARDWLREGAPDGAVVVAARQTHGRGRPGRSWASPAGGLWMTMILKRDLDPDASARLGLGLALVTADVVSQEAGCEVAVRWPNDLILGDKKLGGVLAETEVSGGRVAAALVSLGLNVNVPETGFPLELRGAGVSLLSATGREYPLPRLAARILESFEGFLPAILDDPDAVVKLWGRRDVLRSREVTLQVGGEAVRGRARGIDRQGRLLLSRGLLRSAAVPAGEARDVRIVAG